MDAYRLVDNAVVTGAVKLDIVHDIENRGGSVYSKVLTTDLDYNRMYDLRPYFTNPNVVLYNNAGWFTDIINNNNKMYIGGLGTAIRTEDRWGDGNHNRIEIETDKSVKFFNGLNCANDLSYLVSNSSNILSYYKGENIEMSMQYKYAPYIVLIGHALASSSSPVNSGYLVSYGATTRKQSTTVTKGSGCRQVIFVSNVDTLANTTSSWLDRGYDLSLISAVSELPASSIKQMAIGSLYNTLYIPVTNNAYTMSYCKYPNIPYWTNSWLFGITNDGHVWNVPIRVSSIKSNNDAKNTDIGKIKYRGGNRSVYNVTCEAYYDGYNVFYRHLSALVSNTRFYAMTTDYKQSSKCVFVKCDITTNSVEHFNAHGTNGVKINVETYDNRILGIEL